MIVDLRGLKNWIVRKGIGRGFSVLGIPGGRMDRWECLIGERLVSRK
jgi:hypothetical protein